ncbi:MAG: hypothetical protein LBT11_04520 [Treponema sp.]|jgi:hypothetical protein|nr:hypothetical protein [Treponema sp.]
MEWGIWVMGILAVIGLCIGVPVTLIEHLAKNARHKRGTEIEKLRLQKEMLELELEKENATIRRLEAENHHYDRLLELQPGRSLADKGEDSPLEALK